ncbi:MAG: hypothetical protein WBM28_15985, partial [Burkholderiales bacterium]
MKSSSPSIKSVTVGLATLACFVALRAHAGSTDISATPLVTGSTLPVLPNIMLLLDDSGSMEWQFMPDNVLYVPSFSTVNSINCRNSSGGTTSCGGTASRGSRSSVSPPVDAK